ncbi:hypothetical protein [Asticcacaulis tiandongensis]|uniref:hypothetical protein n=1 Tax=Asticcacaulis tiandongensis TaxID=2565365 RepID=UPI0015E863FC|nr:hypothetical protein [Asticcacaulis tiandongensis]
MENITETIGAHRVLFFAGQGELLGADVNTFLGEAWGQEADWVAIPVSRLRHQK